VQFAVPVHDTLRVSHGQTNILSAIKQLSQHPQCDIDTLPRKEARRVQHNRSPHVIEAGTIDMK
jgi:hypothetical protein